MISCINTLLQNKFLQKNNLVSEQKNQPTQLSFTLRIKYFKTRMDSGQITGAAFLDLSKTFDTVNHELLLQKLTYAGLSNNTVTWFRSYLTYRSIFTMVDNKRSSTMDVPTGVPQGIKHLRSTFIYPVCERSTTLS